ncbi:MAG: hypothetical protein CVU22_12305 [Betaproteobacteria bacterium HGW-Betaproteobacteria-16]|nr:MAG: hypothetical protein CVU22_12305 [Betaproteobacteria bacterium HGW-Betaproteobacteria-16]
MVTRMAADTGVIGHRSLWYRKTETEGRQLLEACSGQQTTHVTREHETAWHPGLARSCSRTTRPQHTATV